MKSVILTKYGSPDVLQVQEFDTPEPKAEQVHVKVHYAGINFAEIMARMRLYPGGPKPGSILGGEVSGIIEKIGSEIKDLEVGQKVIGLSLNGSYSSHVCLDSKSIIPLPENFKLDEAAAFPVIYITAYMMMFDLGNLQDGDTFLIHGAGGGVGTAAIQLAKTKKEIMDFTNNKGGDLIIDPVGAKNWKLSYKLLGRMGKLIIYGDQNLVKGEKLNPIAAFKEVMAMPKYKPMDLMAFNKNVMGYHLGRFKGYEWKVNRSVKNLINLVNQHDIHPVIDSAFSFKKAPDAHRHIQNRKNFGKVLLDFTDA